MTGRVGELPLGFLKNQEDMLRAAAACIASKQFMPAQVLIYAHVDMLAWAASSDKKAANAIRKNFEAWAEKWLVPELVGEARSITATELFAARSAVLHKQASASDLSAKGHAREIWHTWGSRPSSQLDAMLVEFGRDHRAVALRFEDLLAALQRACTRFYTAASEDPVLFASVSEAAALHHVYLDASSDGGVRELGPTTQP